MADEEQHIRVALYPEHPKECCIQLNHAELILINNNEYNLVLLCRELLPNTNGHRESTEQDQQVSRNFLPRAQIAS
jgi:hypothetical protein